eukprot:CAMPEP_0116155468 /NCGR_PEP_ID=MMETSP0329-20121206/22325_1 /TAXON_ID=697910 /ORGANISM="Pseudo-nitzschia arenysensis, Strain B593" /LENGTH=578 /DNA_ID=CAMNT_0003652507 /DNA_START=147 /DNA_END=1884 /DNA_ORIENTATION=+
MYYSSSSSCDDYENDNNFEGRPLPFFPISNDDMPISQQTSASYCSEEGNDTMSTPAAMSADNGMMNSECIYKDEGGNIERMDQIVELESKSKSHPSSHNQRCSEETVKGDDRVVISTLLLEEKIVSLMNRVWILETENDVIRSQWKNDEKEAYRTDDIENMYQNPYASPKSCNSNDVDRSDRNFQAQEDAIMGKDLTLSPQKKLNENESKGDEDPTLLSEKNRSLRQDLTISEEIQERMRVAMVSLENRDKRRSDKIEEMSKQLGGIEERHDQAMGKLHKELKIEKNKCQRFQADLEKEVQRRREAETKFQNAGKACIDGSTGVMAYKTSSTAKAADLISDLSNELKLTMERESKVRDELDALRRERDEDDTTMLLKKELSESRDQHQREKNALLKHNEELESLNIDLFRKLNKLEAECNELVTQTIQERNSRRDTHSNPNTYDKDMRAMEDYLYSLSIKYEESQKEITTLKTRLALGETTTVTECLSQSPPPRSKERTRSSRRTRMQIQHERISDIVRNNDEEHIIYDESSRKDNSLLRYPSDDDFALYDEQREEEDYTVGSNSCSSYSMFQNRAEI